MRVLSPRPSPPLSPSPPPPPYNGSTTGVTTVSSFPSVHLPPLTTTTPRTRTRTRKGGHHLPFPSPRSPPSPPWIRRGGSPLLPPLPLFAPPRSPSQHHGSSGGSPLSLPLPLPASPNTPVAITTPTTSLFFPPLVRPASLLLRPFLLLWLGEGLLRASYTLPLGGLGCLVARDARQQRLSLLPAVRVTLWEVGGGGGGVLFCYFRYDSHFNH